MKKESALELKQEILESLVKESERGAAATQSLVDPRVEGRLAVGYSKKGKDDFQLELRVQSRKGKAYRKAAEFKEKAKDEANIEVIPRIEIPSKKTTLETASDRGRLAQSCRPLHIGLSVGHTGGGAGTLGAFVSDDDGNECILSNCHVLALMGQAKLRDPIFQPGRPDQWPLMARHTVAELSDFPVIAIDERNAVDSAIAILVKGMDHESNRIPRGFGFPNEGKKIRGVEENDLVLGLLEKAQQVCKIGRTTGYTKGRISAVALDNVSVKTSVGNVLFDDVIEIDWESTEKPFSKPGDSGSLVLREDVLIAVGLHFAGGVKLVGGKEIGVSYSCNIATVLKTHNASLLD